jgi:hypothetical protein
MAKSGKPGRHRDAANRLRSEEVGKYVKYYDEQLGGWIFHLLGEDLRLTLLDDGDYACWYEDVPYGRARGRPRGARYDDTPILKLMAQINKVFGEGRPRRLAILAVSRMKLKLNGAQRESVIKRLADRWKVFIRNNPPN